MSYIAENLKEVREQITQAAKDSGRQREDIRLIAVSKTFPASDLLEAHELKQRDFAENRVVEGEEKRALLTQIDWTYHLIGHLQSNKVNKAIQIFNMIHSVDSLSLAEKLQQSCEREKKVMPILIQMNTSGEAQKSGVTGGKDALFPLVEKILSFSSLDLQGLMTIGPLSMSEKETRLSFTQLREALNGVNQNFHLSLPHLSMGMTHDFLWAIQEGATMVRVGTGIFGKRSYPTA